MLRTGRLNDQATEGVAPSVTSPPRLNSSFGQLFRLNTLLFAASMFTSVASYLYHVVTGHLLGQAGYGTVAALVSLNYIVLIPTQVVLSVSTRATAELFARGEVGHLREMWTRLTLWLLLLGAAATAIFSLGFSNVLARFFQVPSGGHDVAIVGLLLLIGFISCLNQGVLQGLHRFGWVATMSASGALFRVVLAAIFILLGWGITGAVLGLVLASLLPYFLSMWPVWALLRGATRQPIALRPWLHYSTTVTIASLATTLLYNLDTILAKHFLPAVEAGNYAALSNAGKIVLFMSGSVVTIMFAKVATAHTLGERHEHLLGFSLGAVLLLSLAVLLAFVAFPGFILAHLFGPAYVTVRAELPWYGVAMLFYSLAGVFVQYFLSVNSPLFLWIVVSCCATQAGALWIWHADVAEMVRVMVVSMALLLLGLTGLYLARRRYALPSGASC